MVIPLYESHWRASFPFLRMGRMVPNLNASGICPVWRIAENRSASRGATIGPACFKCSAARPQGSEAFPLFKLEMAFMTSSVVTVTSEEVSERASSSRMRLSCSLNLRLSMLNRGWCDGVPSFSK